MRAVVPPTASCAMHCTPLAEDLQRHTTPAPQRHSVDAQAAPTVDAQAAHWQVLVSQPLHLVYPHPSPNPNPNQESIADSQAEPVPMADDDDLVGGDELASEDLEQEARNCSAPLRPLDSRK